MTEKNKNDVIRQKEVEQKGKEQNLSQDNGMPEGLRRMLNIISTSVAPIDDKNK